MISIPGPELSSLQGFQLDFSSCGTLELCFPTGDVAVPSVFSTNLAVVSGPCAPTPVLSPAVIISLYLCPELSPLSPAAPGNSGRQSARPLHEGFLFLIKHSGASPEGLVGVVKVKEKTLELLFPGERGCVSLWNIWKGQGWDQGVQVPLNAGGAGSQSLSSSSQMVSNGTKENLKGNMGGKAKLIFLLCPEELGAFLEPHDDIWPPQRDQLMVQSHKENFHIKPEANSLSRHLPGQLQLQEKPSNTSALGY